MSNEALAKMIDNIANKDFNKANDAFNGAVSSKVQDVLDQARIKMAGTIFDPEVAIQPDEELVAGEVTVADLEDAHGQPDLEAEAAADEVEAEIDAADEIELDDESDDESEYEEFGDDEVSDEESEEDSEGDNQ